MQETKALFLNVLKVLHKHGVLEQIILIGSWSQFFYQHYFNEKVLIPMVRTLDLDFLISNPPKINTEINVSELLENMGFVLQIQPSTGVVKYNHPDLMVEFLIPELGRGKDEAYDVKKLHIKAVGLRYLNLIQDHILIVNFEDMNIRIPEPSAYVLHKHIISKRRLNKVKGHKDKESAIEIGSYLLDISEQRIKLLNIFNAMPKGWQKTLLKILQEQHLKMYEFIQENK